MIRSNGIYKYDLGPEEAEEIFKRLKSEIEEMGFDFDMDFDKIGRAIAQVIDNEYGNILRENILERLNNASQEEKYIVWLYCKDLQENLRMFPIDDEDRYGLQLFNLALRATFDVRNVDVIVTLVKIGFINRLEWVRSRCHGSSLKYVFPRYLKPIASEIDKYIPLPDPPDYKRYIDSLIENRVIDTLICLDELLNKENGIAEINKLHGKIVSQPCIIEKTPTHVAISRRIFKSFKTYFYERKKGKMEVEKEIEAILNTLRERFYPFLGVSVQEQFNGCKIWLVESIDKKIIQVRHSGCSISMANRNGTDTVKGEFSN